MCAPYNYGESQSARPAIAAGHGVCTRALAHSHRAEPSGRHVAAAIDLLLRLLLKTSRVALPPSPRGSSPSSALLRRFFSTVGLRLIPIELEIVNGLRLVHIRHKSCEQPDAPSRLPTMRAIPLRLCARGMKRLVASATRWIQTDRGGSADNRYDCSCSVNEGNRIRTVPVSLGEIRWSEEFVGLRNRWMSFKL